MKLDAIVILISILLFVASGIFVNFLREGKKESKQHNDSTLLIFRLLIPVSIILAFVFYMIEVGSYYFSSLSLIISIFLIAIGFTIRWAAIFSLGKMFTVGVTIVNEHKLVKHGIYKTIRNPSYSGLLMYYLGLGIAMHNYFSILILLFGTASAILIRLGKEEKILNDHFGHEFEQYKAQTYSLIPYIY